MAFDFQNFLQGGIAGASQGGSMGGVTGAISGGLLGGLTSGFFGGKNKPDMGALNDIIGQRMQQINDFAAKLDAARGNVLASYQNLSQTAMKNYLGNQAAALAGRGISNVGGAFATGAGQEAVKLQDKYNMLNTEMLNSNANTIAGMENNLFGQQMNTAAYGVGQQWDQQKLISQGLGSAVQSAAPYLGKFLGSYWRGSNTTPNPVNRQALGPTPNPYSNLFNQ